MGNVMYENSLTILNDFVIDCSHLMKMVSKPEELSTSEIYFLKNTNIKAKFQYVWDHK